MELKDKRWGFYHIYNADGTQISTKLVRGTSDNQALGNFFRGNSKSWSRGVYARRIRSVHPRSREEHFQAVVEKTVAKESEIKPESKSLDEAIQLSFKL